ncbi:hypothetical protein AGMMS50293_16290 [Spirochaetia bacterium]|nr:hypothetical protein AGMMS50293_16290 [Spirochaetia bacterium]
MSFELTDALIDDILFVMEDQNGGFLLDTQEAMVVNSENDEFYDEEAAEADEDRYVSLPDWSPSNGYRLMEHFTAGLRNPAAREELSAALNRGKGVFRAFKDALSQYPETEKQWFRYKDREMKREVISWYNALRESWGMALIGSEPEDTKSLVLEDFQFREAAPADREAALELHRQVSISQGKNAAMLEQISPWLFPGDLCVVVESAGGEFAGSISAVCDSTAAALHIRALEVNPEYRGLGLGEALLQRLLEKAGSENVQQVIMDLPAGSENFSRVLLRESFQPCIQRYCRIWPMS